MTQCDRILRHMKEVGPITQAEAFDRYGVCRLPARVADLRRNGVEVKSRFVAAKNRYGETVHFAEYYI